MSNSLPSAAEPEYAAFAAIDWADQKHFWEVRPADSLRVEKGELQNTPEAVDVWATDLYERFQGRPIAVILEQSRGALVYMLAKYSHLVLFPIHPKAAAQYREVFYPSGAKSDPVDTDLLLDFLLKHREHLRALKPDTKETRLLQLLTEHRRRMVNEKTREKNRLTACLKMYFPQVPQWFDDVDTPLVGDLLERWPSLDQLQRAHPGTLRKFFHEHNCRSEERIQERIQAIYQAMPATRDPVVVEGESLAARGFLELLATLRGHIARLDKRIEEVVQTHPDFALFSSLPGAGPVLVPRLIAAFGTQRDRYQTPEEMQRLSGIAPVTERSGKTKWVHMRRACPKFLRQTFHEYAGHSLAKSEWAQAYYESQRALKKSHHTAVRALGFKWQRVMFACWQAGTPYDEQIYLQSLNRRRSPLAAAFAHVTGIGWKLVSGFQKLSENPS